MHGEGAGDDGGGEPRDRLPFRQAAPADELDDDDDRRQRQNRPGELDPDLVARHAVPAPPASPAQRAGRRSASTTRANVTLIG